MPGVPQLPLLLECWLLSSEQRGDSGFGTLVSPIHGQEGTVGVDGHTHVVAEDGVSQEVWGAGVWWAQGWEEREVGVQFGSSTIWAANASVWHPAIGEALHTWLHCVRSGGQGGWGRDWCSAVPWGPCCPPQAGSRACAVGRGKRIRVADFLSLSCSLPQTVGQGKILSQGTE